jgi:GTP cyclohydrolase II
MKTAETRLPTRWGMFRALAYQREMETALVLMMGDATAGGVPLVRIHSQ